MILQSDETESVSEQSEQPGAVCGTAVELTRLIYGSEGPGGTSGSCVDDIEGEGRG